MSTALVTGSGDKNSVFNVKEHYGLNKEKLSENVDIATDVYGQS